MIDLYKDNHVCAFVNFFFNSLPNDDFLDWSKLKAFSDDKINITEKL